MTTYKEFIMLFASPPIVTNQHIKPSEDVGDSVKNMRSRLTVCIPKVKKQSWKMRPEKGNKLVECLLT